MVAATKNGPAMPEAARAELAAMVKEQVSEETKRQQEENRKAVEEYRASRDAAMRGEADVVDLKSFDPGNFKKFHRLPPVRHAEDYERNDPTRKANGIRVAQAVKVLMLAHRANVHFKDMAKTLLDEDKLDPFVCKALQESTIQDGGPLVRPEFASEMIPLLRAFRALSKLGINTRQMKVNQVIFAKQNAPAVAYYASEGMAVTYSQAQLGDLRLETHKLKAVTSATDELLNDGGSMVEEFIRDDLTKVIGLRGDLSGIRGDGTQSTPQGLRYSIASSNIFGATQAGSKASFDEVSTDLGKMIRLVEESNTGMLRCGWIMTPRSKQYLMTGLNTTLGIYPLRDQMLDGNLLTYPYVTTTQVPSNLGGGSNESEIYFGDLDDYMEGITDDMVIKVFPGAAFQGANGTTIYGVNQGVVPVTCEMRHGFAMKHTNTWSALTTVKYGA